jgi:hypothetical protein
MQGPDFRFDRVADWQIGTDGTARLSLADGSHWSIASSARLFAGVRSMVELAKQLNEPVFVSGDQRTGQIERVALPAKLVPSDIATRPEDGRLAVGFHGPPTPAYLHTDRPWFAAARSLLSASIAQETPQHFGPPLLVTIDAVSGEIMDVRAAPSG